MNLEKQNSLADEHNQMRKRLWCDMLVSFTGSANATRIDFGIIWADKALAEFDKRFGGKG